MPNQLNNAQMYFFPYGEVIPFCNLLHEQYEFDKNANSYSVRVRKLVCADWFGDYWSLRFFVRLLR